MARKGRERGKMERQQFKKQIQDHMMGLLNEGKVTRQDLAVQLHVTKQAVSSYTSGRTTPKSHIVRRLLAKWPCKITYRNVEFGPEAFGVDPGETTNSDLAQAYLFEILSSVKKDNMRVDVERGQGHGAEVRVIIKIRA